jgi:MFS family permease
MHAPAAGTAARITRAPGAHAALALLLTINLFNYIDRQVLSAVMPGLLKDGQIFPPGDSDSLEKAGLLTSAFMVAYMVVSPVVGWLDGRGVRRWLVLGIGVSLWSIASGSSGFATGYTMLLLTRCCVGVGEGAYGPVASAMLADIYPPKSRGWVMAAFNMAIPVGSAMGFVIGSQVLGATGRWQPAFWVTFAGLGLGLLCFLKKEMPRPVARDGATAPRYLTVLRDLRTNRSFVLCCAGMTAITYVTGGVAAWAPTYFYQREARFVLSGPTLDELAAEGGVPAPVVAKLRPHAAEAERTFPEVRALLAAALSADEGSQYAEKVYKAAKTPESPTDTSLTTRFGIVLAVGALVATAAGAYLGEWLKKRVRGAYFYVCGAGAFLGMPCYLALLYTPFPLAWVFLFFCAFGLFLNTGPAFTIIANVTRSNERATAFAINILVIHLLGDVISPTIIGRVADRSNLATSLAILSVFILIGGILWALGGRHLDADTAKVEGL